MKVSFVYDDGYVIQLQFAFRRSLRNGIPLHRKRSFVWQAFWRREPLKFTARCRQRRFDFSSSSPYKNYHRNCGYFSFLRFLSVAWPYNYYIFLKFFLWWYPNSWLNMLHHCRSLKYTASLPRVHKHIFIGCQFTFEITDGVSWTLLRWDYIGMHFVLRSSVHDRMHYVRTLVYSIKCSEYCCVHNLPV